MNKIADKVLNVENLSHAYLLKTDSFDKVISLAKEIFSVYNTEEENINTLIDNNVYQDLKIIEPDGQWIKKEQIIDLKEQFKTKSIYNNKRIYIIKNAENLNKSSANTMLKFLEEPEENIIAFLITSNVTKVLDTIVSRCQYLVLDTNSENENSINDETINLFELLESKGINAFFDLINIINKYDDRNDIKELLNNLLYLYEKDMLNLLEIEKDSLYKDIFDKFSKKNTIIDIKRKITGLMLAIDMLEYNVNIKLLLDKLLISMFGVD